MAVFSSLVSFFRRNKRKLIITSTITVSLYLLVNQFVIKRFRNFQSSLRQEILFKEQIKRRFLQTQQDCYYTILALLPVLTDPIVNSLPIEMITQALKMKKTNTTGAEMSDSMLTTDNLNIHENSQNLELSSFLHMSKTELWNELKIKTITRTLTLLCSISGLLLITRLQLNILARRSYLELAIVMAGGSLPKDINSEEVYAIEQAYLSLSWWLLNKGWETCSNLVEEVVVQKFSKLTARAEISIMKFDQLLNEIIFELETKRGNELLGSFFPLTYDNLITTLLNTNPDVISELDVQDSNLVKLINETKSLMSTPSYLELYSQLLSNGMSTLIDNISINLNANKLAPGEIGDVIINRENSFRLANFLAQLSVQNGLLVDNNNFGEDSQNLSGNLFINNLNDLEELDEFSASIYSNFD